MSAGPTAVVSLEEVTKRYGSVTAVERATFTVAPGELFSLLGPSGCGKTTTLRLIAGFEVASSGRICLEGADVGAVPPNRRNVNTVFQHYALFPHLSVFDNVAFGPRSRSLAADEVRRRVDHMLEVVRLADLAARRPDQLSGGQRQRVALARALVNLPAALLLDEPLSALDLKLREAMQRELKRIQREVGITFIFVTHDQHEALTLSDRIAVMHQGRVEQVGTPADIYDAPATAFVAGFVGSANLIEATVEGVEGTHAVLILSTGERALAAGTVVTPGAARSVIMMVRPERVRVTVHRPQGANVVPVTVADLTFAGPVVRCILRDPRGLELMADLAPELMTGISRGASVFASWNADACRIVPLPAPARA